MIEYINEITVEDYNELRASVGWKVLNHDLAKRGLDGSAFITVAYDTVAKSPVAMGRVITDGGYMALIVDVMVAPEYQGRGIGAQLIKNMNKYFEEITSNGDTLMVNLMATKDKEGFYEKLGYTVRPNESIGAGLCKWYNN